jgi:hypothetical protein
MKMGRHRKSREDLIIKMAGLAPQIAGLMCLAGCDHLLWVVIVLIGSIFALTLLPPWKIEI